MSIGISQVDREHERLMQLLHQIKGHQYDDVNSEAISLIIEQIIEVASLHFRHQEEYMLKINYPECQVHKEQHKRFKEKMAAFCIDVMNQKKTAPREIYRFLSEWVEYHLYDSDKKIRFFLDARQATPKKT